MTVRHRLGKSRSMFLRLCCRAPRIRIGSLILNDITSRDLWEDLGAEAPGIYWPKVRAPTKTFLLLMVSTRGFTSFSSPLLLVSSPKGSVSYFLAYSTGIPHL